MTESAVIDLSNLGALIVNAPLSGIILYLWNKLNKVQEARIREHEHNKKWLQDQLKFYAEVTAKIGGGHAQ